ncbi:mitochondrial 37S ribosomal protein bS21m [Apiospora kogelbergensis]|uniref:mitochondrial 37S ribosomal protein bS21m n=1 Tax=Apiospora kogelbergensis TaxID=1337665 RepID=UPI00312FCE37
MEPSRQCGHALCLDSTSHNFNTSLDIHPSRASYDTLTTSIRALSLNGSQMRTTRHYADWSSPSRPSRATEEGEIKKPTFPTSKSGSPFPLFGNKPPTRRTFDAPDTDFNLGGLGDSGVDSTDYTSFKTGDFSKRGLFVDDMASLAVKKPTIRCVPRTGRTIHVSKGAELTRVFKMVDMQCSANRVRQDFAKQKYHERNGQKRKRLVSERWQKKFKNGFRATCKRVSDLRRQGW